MFSLCLSVRPSVRPSVPVLAAKRYEIEQLCKWNIDSPHHSGGQVRRWALQVTPLKVHGQGYPCFQIATWVIWGIIGKVF